MDPGVVLEKEAPGEEFVDIEDILGPESTKWRANGLETRVVKVVIKIIFSHCERGPNPGIGPLPGQIR